MNSQKGFIVPVLLAIIALLVIGGGVYIYENKKTETPAIVDTTNQRSNQGQPVNSPSSSNNAIQSSPSTKQADDISSLKFAYNNDSFTLKKSVAASGISMYEYRTGDVSTVRVYTFVPNDPTVYSQGILGGIDTRSFILWRGSGANIIEPILFVFRKGGGVWQQLTYTKLPADGGRTTIEKFSIENNSILLNVKTSGPEQNYHETYVSKQYVYKLSGNQLLLQ